MPRTIAVSDHLGRALVGHGLYARFEVVPNVLPVEQVPLPAWPCRRLMMVADLVDRTKNVSGVLRALALLRDGGLVLHLDLAGDGPDRGHARRADRTPPGLGQQGHVPRPLPQRRRAGTHGRHRHGGGEQQRGDLQRGDRGGPRPGQARQATRCGGPQAFVHEGNGLLMDPGDDRAWPMPWRRCMWSRGIRSGRIRQDMAERFSMTAVGERLRPSTRTCCNTASMAELELRVGVAGQRAEVQRWQRLALSSCWPYRVCGRWCG